jgi:molecular chaperone GrpE (heat shock protein)
MPKWTDYDEDAHLIANSPTWLRFLLDENERLAKDRDELLRLHRTAMQTVENADSHVVAFQERLEQVKKERDKQQSHISTFDNIRKVAEGRIESLRSELAAKDKVLGWYADYDNYSTRTAHDGHDVIADNGERARSILYQYKGESQSD